MPCPLSFVTALLTTCAALSIWLLVFILPVENLNVPFEKAHTAMHYYGYTGSACIPIAFNDAIEKGKLKENDLVFMIGSGSGLTFGSVAFRY